MQRETIPPKSAPGVPKTGKASQTTRPEAAGAVLPVENPMDLWYLCQKTGFAERFPLRDALGRSLKQRQVSRWVHYDCKGNGWQWPHWGEVGFNMAPGGGRPPEAIMSRREPFRPTTMPLSRYEIVRRRVAFQAGVDSGALGPWVQVGLLGPLVTTEYLENNLSPAEVREAYRLVRAADTGWDWTAQDRPVIPGLLRIPDVVRVNDFRGRTGADRFAADNIAFLIEMKFEGDRLSPEQERDYYRIVNGEFNKFRLLETKACKVPRRKRREWLEKARESEPVFRTMQGGVTSPERLLDLYGQLPQASLLLHDIEAEQQAVRRLFGGAQSIDERQSIAELRRSDSRRAELEEARRQQVLEQLTLILDAPLAGAAAGTALAGGGALAGAAGELGGPVELIARGAQTLARFPGGKVAVTAAAANAAIYTAAAQTPAAGSNGAGPNQDALRMLDMLDRGLTLRVLYLSD